MKRLLLHGNLVWLALLPFLAMGQSVKEISSFGWSVYSHSLGNVFGNFRNEAGLAGFDHFTAGIMAEKKFMLNATSVYAFSLALPLASGAFSVQGLGTGYKNFSRQRVAVAYGMPLASWLNAGLQLDYLTMRIPTYGSAHTFTFGLSALMHWHDQWSMGIQAYNPVQVKYHGLGDDAVAACYRLGLGYQPSGVFFLSAELQWPDDFSPEIAAAFHYRIIKHLGISGGVSTGEEKIFFGISIFLSHFNMIFTAMDHQRLGISPGAGFIYDDKEYASGYKTAISQNNHP